MLRKFSLLTMMFLLVAGAAHAQDTAVEDFDLLPTDRVLVLAPHPDDEVLGAGGVLQRAVEMQLPVKVAFFTHGDSNQWSFLLYRKHPVIMPGAVQQMGLIRRDEAMAASSILGLGREDMVFLGYPDFGTMNIWYHHWNDRPPLRSILTRVTQVPYQGALRAGALYKGEEILKDLRAVIRDFNPTKIFVSHPADHNGDHLALYLYTRVALWDEGLENSVDLFPYLIHYIGWPKPAGFRPDHVLLPPEFLKYNMHWRQYRLTPQEFNLKKAALQAHKSQFASTPKYLLSFVRPNELFGDFPLIRLQRDESARVPSLLRQGVVGQAELPEELNEREKDAFVGVAWKSMRWEADDLVITIELSRPLAKNVGASIYIFGYSKAKPFGSMPKISVRLASLSYNVYDQSKRIDQSSVRVKRTATEVTVRVPLKLLGSPDRVLTSARTYLENVPLDNAMWMAVELY